MKVPEAAELTAFARLVDELAIRDLAARYIDAVYRRDPEAWSATWAEESSWSVLGTEVQGRTQIVAFWRQAMDGFPFVAMQMHSGTLTLRGEEADGRWYLSEHLIDRQGEKQLIHGIYNDRYVKKAGCWLFRSRRYDIIYQGAPDLSGTTWPVPGDR